jgi:hypothetical protein
MGDDNANVHQCHWLGGAGEGGTLSVEWWIISFCRNDVAGVLRASDVLPQGLPAFPYYCDLARALSTRSLNSLIHSFRASAKTSSKGQPGADSINRTNASAKPKQPSGPNRLASSRASSSDTGRLMARIARSYWPTVSGETDPSPGSGPRSRRRATWSRIIARLTLVVGPSDVESSFDNNPEHCATHWWSLGP